MAARLARCPVPATTNTPRGVTGVLLGFEATDVAARLARCPVPATTNTPRGVTGVLLRLRGFWRKAATLLIVSQWTSAACWSMKAKVGAHRQGPSSASVSSIVTLESPATTRYLPSPGKRLRLRGFWRKAATLLIVSQWTSAACWSMKAKVGATAKGLVRQVFHRLLRWNRRPQRGTYRHRESGAGGAGGKGGDGGAQAGDGGAGGAGGKGGNGGAGGAGGKGGDGGAQAGDGGAGGAGGKGGNGGAGLLVVIAVALFIAAIVVLVVAIRRPKTPATPGGRGIRWPSTQCRNSAPANSDPAQLSATVASTMWSNNARCEGSPQT